MGEELCSRAMWVDDTCAWDPQEATGPGIGSRPLAGLSHGAAGFALALLELHAVTSHAPFLDTARAAFAYEDSLFDPRAGNWPDLRVLQATDDIVRAPRHGAAWCHGAPGIALTRLRAIDLDADRIQLYEASAGTALTTTKQAAVRILEEGIHDTSLCHGAAGLAEILLIAADRSKDCGCRSIADRVGSEMSERCASSANWPSGVASHGPNPSLMLGAAGVGHHFLRSHSSAVPPILLLLP